MVCKRTNVEGTNASAKGLPIREVDAGAEQANDSKVKL
jgi:hypothetical protein